ncbi:MAG: serine/threonine-protein kinase [Myxococcota bacterium]
MSHESTLFDDRRELSSASLDHDDTNVDGVTARDPEPIELRRGETMGRYVLLDPIGRGGMGVVYAAYDPELDRRIALKLLRAEKNDAKGSARLAREAQAMAKLVHPNVATVHDVGSFHGEGVFVAMELVDGSDLRTWLKRPREWTEVIAVFLQAGRGLMAAHRVGLIHRDFKPGNVLLSDRGEVKVVDFGLARQLESSLDSHEMRMLADLESSGSISQRIKEDVTRTGALMGTPAYMAPEQHARRSLDARTDQFSFCVALYEALFQRPPVEGHSRVALAMATNRGEVRPPPKGHSIPARITRAVYRGLSPKAADRFPSMAELLAELSYDPGRQRMRLAAGVGATVLLAAGIYGYVRGPESKPTEDPQCPDPQAALADVWDDGRRDTLTKAFERSPLPYAVDTSKFVIERLDRWSDEWATARHEACEATIVHETQPKTTMELRTHCLDRQRKDLAAVAQLLIEADTSTIERADRLTASLPATAACADVDALNRLPPPTDLATREVVETVRDQLSEIRALRAAGRYRVGFERAGETRDLALTTGYKPVIAETLSILGNLQNNVGNRADGETTLHAAAQAATEARYDQILVTAWLDLAWNLSIGQNRHDEGLRFTEYADAVITRMGRPEWLRTNLQCTEGNIKWERQDTEEALVLLQACLDGRLRQDPRHPQLATTMTYVGNVLIDLGRLDDAEKAFRDALEAAISTHGLKHPLVASSYNGLGVVFYHQQRLADAEAQYQQAYELNLELLGPDDPALLYSLGNIANCRRERGEYKSALAAMRKVERLVRNGFPAEHRESGTTTHNIAELLALLDQPEDALEHYERALRIRIAVHGADALYVANTLTGQGETLLTLGRQAEAREALERAYGIREAAKDHRKDNFGRTRFALGRALMQSDKDPARARQLVRQARRDYETIDDSALKRERRDAMDRWLAEHDRPGDATRN